MPLDTELDLGPGDIVLDGKPARPQGGGTAPAILAHVLWPNGAWIKVPFDTGVGLGQGHIVLHEDPAPLKKGQTTPSFRPVSVVDKRLDGSRCHSIGR